MSLPNIFDGRYAGPDAAPAVKTAAIESAEPDAASVNGELSFSDELAIDFLRYGLLA